SGTRQHAGVRAEPRVAKDRRRAHAGPIAVAVEVTDPGMMVVPRLVVSLLALVVLALPRCASARDFAAPALAGDRAQPGLMIQDPPRYGVFYDEREPSFYTGFAPRTQDPARLHLHLGRGNQLRVTAVLADDTIREYARDLAARRRAYRSLIDDGRLELTQNRSL